jgi:acetoin utilization protein AcuB
MTAKDLINTSILSMDPKNTAMEILSWMEEYKVSHLPLVEGKKYLGLLAESDIFDLEDPEAPVGNHNPLLKPFYVQANQHLYEVINSMSEHKLSLIPVLDAKGNYLGVITPCAIMDRFSSYAAVNQPGGIIVLSVNSRDYVASQIVQIVESNDAKLLSLFVSTPQDSTSMDVTLKVNKQDISGILQTFQRYGYDIKASWLDDNDDYLQDRYDSLMNFLSI